MLAPTSIPLKTMSTGQCLKTYFEDSISDDTLNSGLHFLGSGFPRGRNSAPIKDKTFTFFSKSALPSSGEISSAGDFRRLAIFVRNPIET